MPRASVLARFAPLLVVLAVTAPASAHEFAVLDAVVVVKADGTWHADLRMDVDALALGVSPTTPSEDLAAALSSMSPDALRAAEDRARDTLARRIRVRFDDQPVRPDAIAFPQAGTALLARSPEPTVLGTVARLEGAVPDGAGQVAFFASRSFGAVRLTVLDQTGPGARTVLVGPGETSPAYVLGTPPDRATASAPTFATYLGLGFNHIVPRGADHMLFVVGLFLLGRRWRPLLVQISAFTVAHTTSLALAMAGLVRLPASVVEPLIALSIAWVAFENVFTERVHAWRPALVFAFGLLHGLGFAGVLTDLGLPDGEFLPALLGFNVGVEIGQLAVVAASFLLVGWFRARPWYRARIVVPASLAIGAVGLVWAVQRIL